MARIEARVTSPLRATASEPVARVLAPLKGVKKTPSGWSAKCPAHDDSSPSLTVSEGADGRALVKCHRGCTTEAIVAAINLTMQDLFPPKPEPVARTSQVPPKPPRVFKCAYDYTDENGVLLFQTVRWEPKEHYHFQQRRPDGKGGWIWKLEDTRRVLYRLPEVIAARAAGRIVFVTEGEKDADNLVQLGFVATTNAMGANAGNWRDEYSAILAGGNVVICADNDEPGRAHADRVAASLTAHGCKVRVLHFPDVPEKGDVSDWLAAGRTAHDLKAVVMVAPYWTGPTVDRAGESEPEPDARADRARQLAEAREWLRLDHSKFPRAPWIDVHKLSGAYLPGRLIVFGGRENNGKTTFLMSLTQALAAAKQGVYYIPLEQDPWACRIVWAAWELGIDPEAAMIGEWERYGNAEQAKAAFDLKLQEQEQNQYINFADDDDLDLRTLVERCERAKGATDCKVIIIDHFHRLEMGDPKHHRLGAKAFAKGLKNMARRLGVTVIASAQLTRPRDDRFDALKPPSIDRLAETAALGHEADVVLMVSRCFKRDLPKDYSKLVELGRMTEADCEDHGVMLVTCRKNRQINSARNRGAYLSVVNGRVQDGPSAWRRIRGEQQS